MLLADVLDDLNNHDALYITEDGEYERCEAMARWVRLCSTQAATDLCML
jgi:hypothetical protein